MITFILGFLLTISLVNGEYSIGPVFLNLHWMLLGLTLTTLGYSATQLGIISRIYHNFDEIFTRRVERFVTYDRGVITGFVLFLIGFLINLNLLFVWINSGLRLANFYFPGMLGLLLMILGFQTFTFTLILQMILRNNYPPTH
jgi:hypothetical protein